ncbi:hypothetical protein C8046_01855 [Serinibacter arcticus]|uniref:YCII-related domain-containing protein n=1 Tax=Serinibacter arcticus TaxID=1655435 RepID=A0A2U1ZRU4_9MICO|nr:YciI family protein [Serinibacter arcticus]PWD49642.1 hypothetical protein C8046_01855 [Serinibacter arcticus]
MPVFAVEYTYDHRADERTAVRPAHREFLRGLLAGGDLLASGPLGTGEGALLLLVADDEAAALALLDADPFAAAGLVARRDARAWAPVIGPWSALVEG